MLFGGLTEFHGQPAVGLTAPDGAKAVLLTQGAQLVSWIPVGADEQLFLSTQAVYAEGQAVRGGVPVIFPQFECRGPLPRHGFARTSVWSLDQSSASEEDAMAVFQLLDSEATRDIWPHAFKAELTVRLGGKRIDIELAVRNTGETELSFTAALHTYLRVSDIDDVRLSGLQRLRYSDSAKGGGEQIDREPQLAISGEVDRIYFDLGHELQLNDAKRKLKISSVGFGDVVVWNPGPEKCLALKDMPPDGYRHMLCVEAALIGSPETLPPKAEWLGRQSLELL